MKQIKQVFFVFGLLLFMQSCSDKTAVLTKAWRVEELKYPVEVPAGLKEEIAGTVNEMKKAFTLTYHADGTYVSKFNERELKGKWKLNWNSTKITSTPETGEAKDFKIKELNDEHFEFETQEGENTVIFVMVPADKVTDEKP